MTDAKYAPIAAALSLVWAAAWRAQLTHVAIFVVLPLMLGLIGMALAIVLVPFSLVGEGSVNRGIGPEAAHLRDPQCWVFLAPCPAADQALPGIPQRQPAAPVAVGHAGTSDAEPFWEWPEALTWRHLWFGVWLAWFLVHFVRRERLSRRR